MSGGISNPSDRASFCHAMKCCCARLFRRSSETGGRHVNGMSSGDKRKSVGDKRKSVGNDRIGDDPRFGEAREAGSKPTNKGFMFISPSVAGAGFASKADACCAVLVGSPANQCGVLLW